MMMYAGIQLHAKGWGGFGGELTITGMLSKTRNSARPKLRRY